MDPIVAENCGCQPTVCEVGRSKMELGKPGVVTFFLMGGMSMTGGNDMIVEETVEVHDLPQRIIMVFPNLEALWGHLCTICSSIGWVGQYARSLFRSKEINTKKVAKARLEPKNEWAPQIWAQL